MDEELIGIHRTVSLHVLNYIPVMPIRPENSQWPLGFMTNRCRNALRHIESEEQFTRDEIEVSRKILEWERGLDGQVKDIIRHESWKKQKAGKKSWFYPPVVIRAKAGTGKSILVGKIMAELIDAASVELDTGRRAALYKELNEILYNDPMWLIGAQEGVVMAHRDWLKGFVQNPLWPRPSLKFSLFDK